MGGDDGSSDEFGAMLARCTGVGYFSSLRGPARTDVGMNGSSAATPFGLDSMNEASGSKSSNANNLVLDSPIGGDSSNIVSIGGLRTPEWLLPVAPVLKES